MGYGYGSGRSDAKKSMAEMARYKIVTEGLFDFAYKEIVSTRTCCAWICNSTFVLLIIDHEFLFQLLLVIWRFSHGSLITTLLVLVLLSRRPLIINLGGES